MGINQVKFAKVVEAAKQKAASHPEWLRSIEKAAAGILDGSVIVTLFCDNYALVTTPNGSYRVNGACPCAARTPHCYHRTAKRLMELYEAEPEVVATNSDKPATSGTRYCGDRDLQHLDTCKPHIERSVEREFNTKTGRPGRRFQVVRVDGWTV